jgi:adenine/guanine phosphoribosyltransferase-like PRPP-binding protein
VADAERVDEALKADRAAGLDAGDQVADAGLAVALALAEQLQLGVVRARRQMSAGSRTRPSS